MTSKDGTFPKVMYVCMTNQNDLYLTEDPKVLLDGQLVAKYELVDFGRVSFAVKWNTVPAPNRGNRGPGVGE